MVDAALRRTALFMVFEAGVGFLAVLLAWILFREFGFTRWSLPASTAAFLPLWGLPLALYAAWATHPSSIRRFAWVRGIYDALDESPVGDFIRESGWPSFLALSAAAGIFEELLFRGVLQAKIGLWAAALIFGALHAVTKAYFVTATLIGAYLGWVYLLSGGSLLAPAILHAGYDFLALMLFKRVMATGLNGRETAR